MRTFAVGLWILVFLCFPTGARGQTASARPDARFEVTFGLDSLERKFYKPEFRLAAPFGEASRYRAFFNFSYLQKINGDMEGPIDFWVQTGLVSRLSNGLSLEASLNHFCRHQTSQDSPYVLNLNELIGRAWIRRGALQAGIGLGTYVHGSPGYNHLAVFNLSETGFLLPELSFSGEFKWVNFSKWVYEADIAVALSPGIDLVLTEIKPYALSRDTHLGVRFRSTGKGARLLREFNLSTGAYPFFDAYKLMIDGSFRLAPLRESPRRFFIDVAFQSPVLAGSGFWGSFWPDRMIYEVSAEIERAVGRYFVSWYGRYLADMPTDKDVRFRASVATGATLRNQHDFNRLDLPVRCEIRAGFDLKFKYDFGLKLGLNTTNRSGWKAGVEGRLEANAERRAAEARVFLDIGRTVSFRPFLGIRRVTPLAGNSISDGTFKRILMAGFSFYKWFN
jgi:hypothetical protein